MGGSPLEAVAAHHQKSTPVRSFSSMYDMHCYLHYIDASASLALFHELVINLVSDIDGISSSSVTGSSARRVRAAGVGLRCNFPVQSLVCRTVFALSLPPTLSSSRLSFPSHSAKPTMNRLLGSATARPFLSAALRSLRAATSPSSAAPNVIATLALSRSSLRHNSHAAGTDAESFADFSKRYTSFFDNAEDLFELQRGLNNCFAYDLVPGVDVIESALRASRRLDTYSTAVRIFEGIREKVENNGQYELYLQELKGIKEELGARFSSLNGLPTIPTADCQSL